jgi:hypothetical protein
VRGDPSLISDAVNSLRSGRELVTAVLYALGKRARVVVVFVFMCVPYSPCAALVAGCWAGGAGVATSKWRTNTVSVFHS